MDEQDGGPLLFARFLPYRLSVLANRASSALAGQYSQRFGLSIPQWRVIAVLANEPGISAVEVAERTAMDEVAVSRAVATLHRNGRIDRRPDAADGRRSRLALSAAGQAVYAEVVPLARRFERRLSSALHPSDRRALDRILDLLLDELSPAAAGPEEASPSSRIIDERPT
jgi:DNA-binding MarR family transcriptional regulator